MKELFNIYNQTTKKEKRLLLLATLIWSLWTAQGSLIIVLIVLMVKELLTPTYHLQTVYWYWAVIAGLFLLKGVFLSLANIFSHLAGYEIVGRLRAYLIARLKAFSLGYFTKERLGNISTVIHHDIDNLEALAAHLWTRLLADILVSAIIAVVLFFVNWRLGLGLISLLPAAFLFLWLGGRRGSKVLKKNRDNMSAMVSCFVEYTKGIPTLRSYSENPVFLSQLQQRVAAFGKSSRQAAKVATFYVGGYNFFVELAYGIVAATGVYMFLAQNIGLVTYVVFIILGKEFYKPFANAEVYWINYVRIRDSYSRINAILEHPVIPEPARPKIPEKYSIHFDQVFFRYGKEDFSLENIDFTVPENTVTALVGPTGSGKTTIVNLLLRFWDVQEGAIRIGGVDIRDVPYDDLLALISIVMQDVILFNDTILENIRVGKRNASFEEIVAASKRAMLHDVIMSLPYGYDTKIGEQGAGLSGGEKQRLTIARAILKDAPIIILDEATSAVDPINERKIQLAFNNLVKGKTVLVIAHHLQTIRHADQIIVLDRGRIAEKGRHGELMERKGIYQRLWDAQIGAKGWKFAI